MSEEPEVLYESVDQMYPDYTLKVVRKGDRTGHLTITFKGDILHQEDVSLSYGAVFGPDVMDIGAWGHIACEFVDKDVAKRAGKTN